MDIIANHTADVIQYRERDAAGGFPYRARADYPYSRRGGASGPAINAGFAGDEESSPANFAKLADPTIAYTPFVTAGEEHVKVPDWLNDPLFYHNRGNSTFTGESSRFGDFAGLDDLFTEHPRVREGMIQIYRQWITDFGIDGYRIDTARHVDPGFWQAFIPAMLETAHSRGIPNFAIFGEVAREEPANGYIAQYTRRDGYPAVLDFAFQSSVRAVLGQGKGTNVLADLFDGDVLYEGGEAAALTMPTFLGNHDMGRFASLVRHDRPGIADAQLAARVRLAHVMLLTLRGAPVIYYGDEQGFIGDGNDNDAREDMFATRTPRWHAGGRWCAATANSRACSASRASIPKAARNTSSPSILPMPRSMPPALSALRRKRWSHFSAIAPAALPRRAACCSIFPRSVARYAAFSRPPQGCRLSNDTRQNSSAARSRSGRSPMVAGRGDLPDLSAQLL